MPSDKPNEKHSETPVWIAPPSVEVGEQQVTELFEQMQELQLQLSDPNRTNRQGARLNWREYSLWRHSIKTRLSETLAEYRQLQKWLKERRTPTKRLPAPNALIDDAIHAAIAVDKVASKIKNADDEVDKALTNLHKTILALRQVGFPGT